MIAGARAFGDDGLRLELPGRAPRRAILRALRDVPGVLDVVVTEHHALVIFEPELPPDAALLARALDATGVELPVPREHRIRVRYDGPDLDEVARALDLSRAELTGLHAAPVYEVAIVGFLPGFAYLRGLDPRLVVPRRSTPRPRVAPLAVGLAGPYTGIYPFASPGGWSWIGNAVGFAPFDAEAGATLALGDRVRFVAVDS